MNQVENANLVPNWCNYVAAIGLGSSYKASCARLVRRLECKNSGDARRKVAALVSSAKLQADDAMTYLDAISEIESMYAKGEQTHKVNTNTSDWHSLGDGCHMKRIIKGV